MKKKLFLCVALTALIATFFGCSNMLNTHIQDASENKAQFQITLGSDSSARKIKAADWKISDVSKWKVTFEPATEGEGKTEIGYVGYDDEEITDPATITVNYDSKNKTLSMDGIATGTYSLKIEGSGATTNQKSFTVCGELDEIVIQKDSTASKTIYLGLPRAKTGTLELTLTNSGDITYSTAGIQAILTPTTVANTEAKEITLGLSAASDDSETATTTGNSFTYTNDTTATLSIPSLPSGEYILSFKDTAESSNVSYKISEDKSRIEIADDITTSDTVELKGYSQINYYATNNTNNTAKNGYTEKYPKEINALLDKLAEDLPERSSINIYMDYTAPVLNINSVSALQTAVNNAQKETTIEIYEYNGATTSSLSIQKSSDSVNTLIEGDVVINPVTEKTLTVSNITNSNSRTYSDIYITLKDGATIVVTDTVAMSGSKTLYIKATDADATADNFDAYLQSTSNPLLKLSSSTEATIDLCAYNGTTAIRGYKTNSVTTDSSTSIYAIETSSSVGELASVAENATITAYYSSATTTTYNDGNTIPYTDGTLTFTLTGVDSATSFAWYFNNNKLSSTESTCSFNPTEVDGNLPDDINTVTVEVQIYNTWYSKDFMFYYSTTDYSRAVYITENTVTNNYTLNEIEYDNASATGTSLSSIAVDSTTAYTFDDSQNLWITSYDDNLKLVKQPKSVSSDSFYNTLYTEYDLTAISLTSPVLDITYNTVDDKVYVLATETTTSSGTTVYTTSVYAFEPATLTLSTTQSNDSASIDTSSWTSILTTAGITSVKFTKIAVNGTTAYLADAAYNVFKITNFMDTTSSPTYVGNLANKLNITDTTDLTLTDMQIGDGFGNDTGNLYVLMRQVRTTAIDGTFYDGDDSTKTFYSRGALCKIDSSNNFTSYGFSTTTKEISKSNGSKTIYFYTPGEAPTNVEFYGPLCFAAVSPKKLVIADDGFYYYSYTDDDDITHNELANKDGFLEFDIDAESNQLSRTSANVTITAAPSASAL